MDFVMPNMENYFLYEDYQYQLIAHILVFGFGAMLAGLVYFAITASSVAPKYRMANYLGCVVMVSAALILFTQYKIWNDSFQFGRVGSNTVWFNPTLGVNAEGEASLSPGDDAALPTEEVKQQLAGASVADGSMLRVFSNGYRYMNWTIDVPTLQIQLLTVLGLSGAAFFRNAVKFTIGGLAMIYTSYVAQFFEPAFAPDADWSFGVNMFWLFYFASWVAYVYILYAVYTGVFKQTGHMHPRSQKLMRGIWWLFVGSWTAYAIAIAMPAIAYDVHGAVTRQYLFTFSDVISKVIFGAMISRVALYQSAAEGYAPAIASCQWDALEGNTVMNHRNDLNDERSHHDGLVNHDRESEQHSPMVPR